MLVAVELFRGNDRTGLPHPLKCAIAKTIDCALEIWH